MCARARRPRAPWERRRMQDCTWGQPTSVDDGLRSGEEEEEWLGEVQIGVHLVGASMRAEESNIAWKRKKRTKGQSLGCKGLNRHLEACQTLPERKKKRMERGNSLTTTYQEPSSLKGPLGRERHAGGQDKCHQRFSFGPGEKKCRMPFTSSTDDPYPA